MEPNQALLNEALKKLFQAIASKDGITVKFERDCAVPHVDERMVVTLPPPSAVAADKYWFYAMHELGHLFKELDWSFKELWDNYLNPEDELSVHVANLIVDNLNERNFYGQYDGVDGILDHGRAEAMKDFMKHDPKKFKDNAVAQLLLSGAMVDAEERQDWMGTLIQAMPFKEYSDQLELSDKIRELGYRQRVKRILSSPNPSKETFELVRDLLRLIGHEPQEAGGGQGEGEGEGDGNPGSSGVCSECKGSGEGDDGEDCQACGGTGDCNECEGSGQGEMGEPCKSCHSDRAEAPKGRTEMEQDRHESQQTDANHIGSGHDNGAEYQKAMQDFDLKSIMAAVDKRMSTPPLEKPKEEVELRRYHDGADGYIPWDKHKVLQLEKDYTTGNHHPSEREAIKHALGGSTVSKQISKYLKALVSESYIYGQRAGKIHQKSLHRLVSHNHMSGQQPSIYKKRNATAVRLDSAVTVQLDCSGSMSGSKYIIGSACCVAIADTLNSLGIPHEILGFTEHYGLTSYVFKNFGTKLTKEKLMSIMASNQVSQSQNADGESVMWAAERLMKRQEKNKLHIVLSDGMPCGSFHGDGRAYLEHVTQVLQDQSPINLVGIGICTNAVERFYKHHVVVNDPAQLDGVLFKVLRDFLV